MNVDLDKTDLINLVMGFDPDYSQMDERYGQYHGGFNDYWKWDSHKLSQLSESDLWSFYQRLKEPIVKNNHQACVEDKRQKEINEMDITYKIGSGWAVGAPNGESCLPILKYYRTTGRKIPWPDPVEKYAEQEKQFYDMLKDM